MSFRRVIWIVLDSVGIGEMPDAAQYGDAGSDTLGHIAQSRKLHLNNLCRLGLGNIRPLDRLPPDAAPQGAYGTMRAGLARQGHHHGPLGNGGHSPGEAVSRLSRTVSRPK